MNEYHVEFEDCTIAVMAADRDDAQEAAIEESERMYGSSTAIRSVKRVA